MNDLRFAVLKEYANKYDTATEEQVNNFVKRRVALDGGNAQLRFKYIPEFENVISDKRTDMFFQIGRRASMIIELQLAAPVPLIKP